jgi:serine/threonine-protein kinase
MLRRVADRYDIVTLLGEGGMGVVYDAIHTSTGRRVALKVLSLKGAPLKTDVVARFSREARAAGAISSKHIVQVLDAGTDPETGAPFLAMEKLRGQDLREVVRPLGVLPVDLSLRIVAQACVGLAKAHGAGVVHRDIKLGNLFLAEGDDDERVIKVLDFGIAKVISAEVDEGDTEVTVTGTVIGSPQYMSPEQTLGRKEVDARRDLWSVGVVLYRLLTGHTPHHGAAAGELVLRICSNPPPPVQSIAPWVPAEVARIVRRALQLRPEDRYPSAQAMLNDLRALLPAGFDIHERMLVPISPESRALVAPRAELSDPELASLEGPRRARLLRRRPCPSPGGARRRSSGSRSVSGWSWGRRARCESAPRPKPTPPPRRPRRRLSRKSRASRRRARTIALIHGETRSREAQRPLRSRPRPRPSTRRR